ncbi:hypothetical protein BBJ28_00007356 [Nothophytophthora sp. Chile5]|nr:hypothetical protein BBJ28_00007356 [Nothophytophthora sp. Chile5]
MLATRYELLDKIGNGAFGEVHRAKALRSGDVCAVKRLRVNDDGQLAVVPAAQFQEIEALRQLQHPNARYCKAPQRYRSSTDTLMLPFRSAEGVLKLSDFGLATVFVGRTGRLYSHQVATRWYRAPELLFGARQYDAAVDMWAVGAIFAELLRLTPLFPGQNDLDQLFRVIQVLGDIERQWPGVRELPDYNKVHFPAYDPMPLSKLFPDAEKSAVDLLSNLLALDPSKRLSAQQALTHDFFFDGPVHSRFGSKSSSRQDAKIETEPHDGDAAESDAFLASLGKPLLLC